jgi:endonuclease III
VKTPPKSPFLKAVNSSKGLIEEIISDLPNGVIRRWEIFLDRGGYSVTVDVMVRVCSFVRVKQRNAAFVSEAVKFQMLVRDMRKEILFESARDAWTQVLPPKSSDNFNFCCLFLMIATPNTPDGKIIEVFGPLFQNNYVTAKWVLEVGEEGIAKFLRVLGRQNMTAKYIINISENWIGLSRNYRALMELPGVGAKVALVTVAECYNLSQGVPCDVHMVRIFKALSWMPLTLDEDCLMDMDNEKKGKKDDEYELARASIEGWFPPIFWPDLNQTYAGLGQLLRIDESRKSILNYVDIQARNWESKWRLTDLRAIRSLVQAYQS